MPLFTRRRPNGAGDGGPPPARVLTAAGMKIDPTDADSIRSLSQSRQTWQNDAWDYRDMIGELRFGTEFLSHAVAKCGWFAAQVNEDGHEPIELASDECDLPEEVRDIAEEELARLPFDAGEEFLGRMVQNLITAGEGYLHSYESSSSGVEEWAFRSVDELIPSSATGKGFTLHEGAGKTRDVERDEDVVRVWYPHARRKWVADSAMRPLLDVCEDIVLAGREGRAASRSRVAANGILLVPKSMTMVRQGTGNEPTTLAASDSRFVRSLTEALTVPIANELDAGSVAPVLLVGEPDDMDKLRHLTFVRETSAEIGDKVTRGLRRLATGLDIPAEIITGLGESNHWSAWLIDASTARYHVDPWCRIVASCITGGFLRPALRSRGVPPKLAARVQCWFDLGPVTENPNRREDAKDAHDRFLISDERARQDLGYDEQDRPKDEEVLRRVAIKAGLQPALVAEVMANVMRLKPGTVSVLETPEPAALPPGGPDAGRPEGGEDDSANPRGGGTPNDGTPSGDGSPEGVQASAAPVELGGYVIDVEACRAVVAPEAALVDRVLAAGDLAIERAIERAGAKVRTAARAVKGQAGDELRARIDGVDNALVISELGLADRAAVHMALGIEVDRLLADAFAPLEDRYARWLGEAVDDTVRAALRVLDPDEADALGPITRRRAKRTGRQQTPGRKARKARAEAQAASTRSAMRDRAGKSWAVLSDELRAAAERQLYRPGKLDAPTKGETPSTLLSPGAVGRALDEVGGEEGAGLSGSPDLLELLRDAGARELGREWDYGTSPRETFEPHRNLDGVRFTGWGDAALSTAFTGAEWIGTHFRPRDHVGCMCRTVRLHAVIADPDEHTEPTDTADRLAIDAALRDLYGITTEERYG